MKTRLSVLLCVSLIAIGNVGCGTGGGPTQPEAPAADIPSLAGNFSVGETGTISGRVLWEGPKPTLNSYRAAGLGGLRSDALPEESNAALPVFGEGDGVGQAVVFLARVDLVRSKPWDKLPVRVEMREPNIVIEQGTPQRVGIVRRGDKVSFSAADGVPAMLRARGAAFFTLPFQSGGQPIDRTLTEKGLVEISSAAGHFWARGWLFVAEHPYFCVTDRDGHFRLDEVPDGTYELVCWMPNWSVARFDRDPEILNVTRVEHHPPVQRSMQVVVHRGETATVVFRTSLQDFASEK